MKRTMRTEDQTGFTRKSTNSRIRGDSEFHRIIASAGVGGVVSRRGITSSCRGVAPVSSSHTTTPIEKMSVLKECLSEQKKVVVKEMTIKEKKKG
jgi:hypothetical protein